MTALPELLACPTCLSTLRSTADGVRCVRGHEFPIIDGYLDFLAGERPQDAGWAQVGLTADAHANEAAGLVHRVENYVVPYIRQTFGSTEGITLLDDGAGYGHAVPLLREHGIDAYGIDPGSRRDEWAQHGLSDRLFSGSGRSLPFADESFDVVFSSGVLEHVGEHLPEGQRGGPCAEYIREVIRVMKPDGRGLIAHPNGLHPIDFWHTNGKRLRVHSPREEWMPRPADLRRWVAASPLPARVEFLSPHGFLAFETIKQHLYGRVLAGSMRALFRTMDRAPVLARTAVNPWLVTEVRRLPS